MALSACEIGRPEGAYQPPERDAGNFVADQPADSDDEIYGDAQGESAGDAGDGQGPTRDASVAASLAIGDYWMRADVHTSVSASMFDLTMRTTTDSVVYALVTVRANDDALELRDFQCAVRTSQKCDSGCRSISTALRNPRTSARAYLPPRRVLELSPDGTFRAARGPYAIGWKGDFSDDVALPLPTSDDDPLVYDPDGGGQGVDITTTVRGAIGLPVSCSVRSVQRVDVTYEGTLDNGKLASGTMRDVGSVLHELSSSCSTDEAPTVSAAAPSTLRFLPAKTAIDVAALPWPCPSLAEFDGAFDE